MDLVIIVSSYVAVPKSSINTDLFLKPMKSNARFPSRLVKEHSYLNSEAGSLGTNMYSVKTEVSFRLLHCILGK
jgi:hypothetical protein